MRNQSLNLLYLHAAAFSWVSYCLAYAFVDVFSKNPQFLFQINVFCGSRAEVVLRPIFVTWLCRACVRTRGFISLKFFTPWLHCVLWLQSRSCFTAILVTWLCRACVRTRGLISINFITPRSCLQFVLGIVAPAEVVSRQFLLPVSVKRFI